MSAAAATGKKLRIAALGCGRMGQHHVNNIRYRTPRAQLVAIADPGPLAAQWVKENMPDVPPDVGGASPFTPFTPLTSAPRLHDPLGFLQVALSYIVRVVWANAANPVRPSFYSNPEEVFDLPDVDAVVISTTTNTHAPLTIKAIEKGKHVLLEKPISIDVADSKPVVEVANANPAVKVMIGFVRRYDTALNQLYDHITSNAAGKPFILKSTTCDAFGGIFMDCGIHDIDMTRWLLNVNSTTAHSGLHDLTQSSAPVTQPAKQVKRVIATGSIVAHPELKEQDDCDNALGIVEFANGATCTLHLSRTGMNGYESTVEVYGLEQKLTVETPDRSRVKVADGHGRRFESTPKYIERFGEAFVNEMNAFAECCLDDKPVKTTPDDALQAAIIAKALTHSFRTGLPVEFDEQGEPRI
ncbi:hypothetical protein EHS25_003549 [Saitozyma podzolica]|uniref:Gfo/Idh/MocA-like oxidoreductase N-terminal domain-containing protein n=1 Tax=Saitozyma podzolica TaxID=1890683 RepID=A0A427Y7I6_9TREE|nr:hypothetical protein EHS25_003549 [Saitozyma podzolica]